MAKYEVNGQLYELPDDTSQEDAWNLIQQHQSQTEEPAETTEFNPEERKGGESVDPDSLQHSQDWLNASQIIWDMNNNKPFEGSAKDLAEYGLDQMGWFNYNLPRMAIDTARISAASPDQKKAFLYMMNTYDDLELSWGGVLRFGKGVLADPTTYVGLTTLGVGAAGGQATKLASKEALKSLLKVGATGAVEGAIFNTAADSMVQQVRTTAGEQEGFQWSDAAKAAGFGAGLGFLLGGAADAAGTILRKAPKDVPGGVSSVSETPVAPTVETPSRPQPVDFKSHTEQQLELGLEDTRVPDNAAQARITQAEQQGRLNVNEGEQGALFGDLPYERRLDDLPDFVKNPTKPVESQTDMADRLMEKWGVSHQGELPLEGEHLDSALRNMPTDTERQGLLFDNLPEQKSPQGELNLEQPKPSKGKTKAEPKAPEPQVSARGVVPSRNPVLDAINEFANDTGVRIFPKTREGMGQASSKAVDELLRTNKYELARIVEEVRRAELRGEATSVSKHTFLKANQKLHLEVLDLKEQLKLAPKGEKAKFYERIDKLLELQDSIRAADLDMSSMSGADLGSRVGHIETGEFRKVTKESFLPEGKTWGSATEFQRKQAVDRYLEALDLKVKQIEAREAVVKVTEELNATPITDQAATMRLIKERELALEAEARLNPDDAAAHSKFVEVLKYLNEYVISTVFTTKTLLINILPSAVKMGYRPALDFAVKGGGAKAWREMTATYAAFGSHMDHALKMAALSFKVERGLLNGVAKDEAALNKMLEQQLMFKGTFGRYLRFFPRVLGATDEFFGQLNYRSYVQAAAAGDAWELGTRQGLKGKALDDFIKGEVTKSIEGAFEQVSTDKVVDFLRQTGAHNYKLSGAKLDHFVMTELQKNGELFQHATKQYGLEYANDLAFKREFHGAKSETNPHGGKVSAVAKEYERFVNNNPWMRLMGQLFFRTPVRVFQEGFRLTAGLQILDPTFLRDLRGNGPGGKGGYAQIRAQGEAMLSFAIATAVMSAYARGAVTGGGSANWKERRSQQDGGYDPYTLRFNFGGKDRELSFRNLDPFSTPIKIIVNAMNRYEDVMIRKAQGDFDNKADEEVLAYMASGIMAVTQAIKDANLTEGIEQLFDLAGAVTDLENKDEQIIRWLGQKAQLLIPNQVQKTRQWIDDPTMRDPGTVGQAVRNRFNPNDPLVPRRYDAFGYEVNGSASVWSSLTGIDFTTEGERPKWITADQEYASKVMATITANTDTAFIAPYKAKSFAAQSYGTGDGMDFDLRTKYTSDGSETYYDRLQRYTRESGSDATVADHLKRAIAAGMPMGTSVEKQADSLGGVVREALQFHREQAWHKLMQEEKELTTIWQDATKHKQAVQSGSRDVWYSPYAR